MPATPDKPLRTPGFNYCRFAKTLVAVPVFVLVADMTAGFFTTPALKILAAVVSVALVYGLAVWLDRLPFLQRKFRARIGTPPARS